MPTQHRIENVIQHALYGKQGSWWNMQDGSQTGDDGHQGLIGRGSDSGDTQIRPAGQMTLFLKPDANDKTLDLVQKLLDNFPNALSQFLAQMKEGHYPAPTLTKVMRLLARHASKGNQQAIDALNGIGNTASAGIKSQMKTVLDNVDPNLAGKLAAIEREQLEQQDTHTPSLR